MKKISIFLIGILLIPCGCSLFRKKEEPPPPPTRVVLEFEAGEDLNPNDAGRASPVAVVIYQLTNDAEFKEADFIALYERDEEVLGKTLGKKKELFLKPGEKRTVSFDPKDKIRAVGIMAVFRYFEEGSWKVAAPIRAHTINVIHLSIRGTNIEINKEDVKGVNII